ncbi:OmpA family protein, partial [Flavobacterium sp.]
MKKLLSFIAFAVLPLTVSAQEQFSVFFDTNKHELTKTQQERLGEWIAANKTSKILAINGYTDEDGSIGMNDTLAQRRVTQVFGIVKGKVSTREDFKTRSFGKLHQ